MTFTADHATRKGDGYTVGVVQPSRDGLSDDEKKVLERLLIVLEFFREKEGVMPVHKITALLRVALEEHQSVVSYAAKSRVANSVMSRHLRDIGDMTRNRTPGLGLVMHRPSPHSMREEEVSLTRSGLDLLRRAAAVLKGKREVL